MTVRRRSAAARAVLISGVAVHDVAAKLRGVLIVMLGAGMIAVAAALVAALHLHSFTKLPAQRSPRTNVTITPRTIRPGSPQGHGFNVPLSVILWVLLIVALVAAVVLSVWWSRRFRPPARARKDDYIAADPEDLREAVESGRAALRSLDDARAAIIACYVAMEASLAERGAARAAADTPDELLARATGSGLVRGTAAARLTALFYEARFSSHPLGRGQRDAAQQALDELAADLTAAATP
jgi:flagellar basal body-associated protein FliL